jgi:hypothetical protein
MCIINHINQAYHQHPSYQCAETRNASSETTGCAGLAYSHLSGPHLGAMCESMR